MAKKSKKEEEIKEEDVFEEDEDELGGDAEEDFEEEW